MKLLDNIWWTKKSKIEAEKRLLANAFQAQILLLWYSFISVATSIYYLKFSAQSEHAGISWVIFSILILCISGFINSLGYKERSSLLKDSYEALHKLCLQEKYSPSNNQSDLVNEYGKILSICENHSNIDYYLALCKAYLHKSKLDRKPTLYIWFFVIWYKIKRILLLVIFYLILPALVFLYTGA